MKHTLAGDLGYLCETLGFAGMPEADDAQWMRLGLREAMTAEGRSHPNPAVGAILIRADTALNDGPRLTVRSGRWPAHRNPVRVIADPNDRLPGSRSWLGRLADVFDETAPTVYLHGARRRPVGLPDHVVARQVMRDRALPAQILDHLAAPDLAEAIGRPLDSLLLEGGPRLHGLFFEAGLVDVVHVLIAPTFGGGMAHRIAPATLPEGLRPIGSWTFGRDVLAEFASKRIATFLDRSGINPLPKILTRPETALN